MLTGYIYNAHVVIMVKFILGQTYQTFKERQRCHFKGAINPKDPSYETLFSQSFKKTRIDKFTWKLQKL